MCVLQTCVTLHQERCVRSSIKSGEYPEKAEFLPESRSKSGSNYAETKYFGKSQVAGVINRGYPMLFVLLRSGKFGVDGPQRVAPYTIEHLLSALVSLGAQGKPFKPDLLKEDFGSESALARRGICEIHSLIVETDSKKARAFFSQWKILFEEVCGYDVEVVRPSRTENTEKRTQYAWEI